MNFSSSRFRFSFSSISLSLLCFLFLSNFYIIDVICQDSVFDGELLNGVPMIQSISQGDSHYYSFIVSPTDSSCGSPMTDLSFLLMSSSVTGVNMNILTPSGISLQPNSLSGNTGILLINRTDSNNNSSLPFVEYGIYLLQIFSGQSDSYTISAALSKRVQLIPNVSSIIACVNGSSAPFGNSYAQFLIQQTGSMTLTFTMTVDYNNNNDQQLPSIYWSLNKDLSSWHPTIGSIGSLTPKLNQLDVIVTIYLQCASSPCQLSFLIMPQSLQQQCATRMTLTNNITINDQFDAALGASTSGVALTQPASISRGQVSYNSFQQLNSQANIQINVRSCNENNLLPEIILMVNKDSGLPDMYTNGASWSIKTNNGTSPTLNIQSSDVQFSPNGPTIGQQLTMEGEYIVSIYARDFIDCYQIFLNITDQSNLTAPALSSNIPVNGLINSGQLVYFRFTTPRDYDDLDTDIIISCVNCSLYVSDIISTPGPTTSPQLLTGFVINRGLNTGTGSGAVSLNIASNSLSLHAGIYYIGVYNYWQRETNFSVIVGYNIHNQLKANTTWTSDQPLIPTAKRYFDYIQQGLTTQTVTFTITGTASVNTQSSLLITQTGRVFPYSSNLSPRGYPDPNTIGSYNSIVSTTTSATGVMMLVSQVTFTCQFQFSCIWQISLASNNSPDFNGALYNYSLAVDVSSELTAAPLQPDSPVFGVLSSTNTRTLFQLKIDDPCILQITLNTQSAGASYNLQLDSDHVLVTGQTASYLAQYSNTTISVTNNTGIQSAMIKISPSDEIFGLNSASNIGASFTGIWYIAVVCATACKQNGNFTLSYTRLPYNDNVPILSPLSIRSNDPITGSLIARQYAFYSFMTPLDLSNDMDITIAVGPIIPLNGTILPIPSGGPNIFISPIQKLPSIQNLNFTNSIFGAGISQSITLSNEDSTLPQPGQILYISVHAAHLLPLNFSLTISVNRRLIMTGAGEVEIIGPIVPGFTQIINLILPGQSNSVLFVSNSFIYSLVAPTTTSRLPTMAVDILQVNTDQWNPSFGIIYENLPFAPAAINIPRQSDRCSRFAGNCIYKFLLYFPSSLPSATFSINNLKQIQNSSSNSFDTQTISMNNNYPIQDSLQAGQLKIYSLSIPLSWIFTANINITVKPLDSQSDPNLLLTAGTGVQPVSYVWPNLISANPAGQNENIITTLAPPYLPTIFITVQGVTNVRYELYVNVTETPVQQILNDRINLTLGSDDRIYPNINGSSGAIFSLTIPADFTDISDLYLILSNTSDTTNTASIRKSLLVLKNVYPTPAALQYYQSNPPRNSPIAIQTVASINQVSMIFRTQSIGNGNGLVVGPGDILYVIIPSVTTTIPTMGVSNIFQLSVSYSSRQSLTLGSAGISGSLSSQYAVRSFTLTIPGVSHSQLSNGVSQLQWYNSVRFYASLSTNSPGSMQLFATLSDKPRAVLPFSSLLSSTAPFNDVSSTRWQSVQQIDIEDVCLQSICQYSIIILQTINSSSQFTLTVANPSLLLPLIPGIQTSPTFISTGFMQYYQFVLPHPFMTITVELQSLIGANSLINNTNADIFMSYSEMFPSLQRNQYSSQFDDQTTGYDSITVMSPINPQYGVVHLGVLGARAGFYQLMIQLIDNGSPNTFISNNQFISNSIQPGFSHYYQYQLGEITPNTDLSILLRPSPLLTNVSLVTKSAVQLFGTFSYSRPGLVNGQLPTLLNYEMISNLSLSQSVAQITLTQTMSSSNLLPLHSQSILYVAACLRYGSNIDSLPYQLSVSLSQRIFLIGDSNNPLLTSTTLTRVNGGNVQYFQITFLSWQPERDMQAVLAITGLDGKQQFLPSIYLTNSILAPLVDPLITNTATFSTMANSSNNIGTLNALAVNLSPLCPSSSTTSCMWKAMVPVLFDSSSYSVAVTAFYTGDQIILQSGFPVRGFVPSGRFAFFAFLLPLEAESFLITLKTLDSQGNVDLFVSNSNPHPIPQMGGYQWQSTNDNSSNNNNNNNNNNIDQIGLSLNDEQFLINTNYYVSVFGQRVSAFEISVVINPNQSNNNNSNNNNNHNNETVNDNNSSSNIISLAVFLPILLILAILCFILLIILICCYHRSHRNFNKNGEKFPLSYNKWKGNSEDKLPGVTCESESDTIESSNLEMSEIRAFNGKDSEEC